MGIVHADFYRLGRTVGLQGLGRSMLELGNQFLQNTPPACPPEFACHQDKPLPVAKKAFEYLGWKHTSIDLNGQDGALVCDLSAPFDLGQRFDVITDFGTSEHVQTRTDPESVDNHVCLYHCLRNIHNHAHDGTVIVHVNPRTGSWPGHGFHYRTLEFYQEFCHVTGYSILELVEEPMYGNDKDGWVVACVALVNNAAEFPSRSELTDAFLHLRAQ